jgi:signal transduction histidine kinase
MKLQSLNKDYKLFTNVVVFGAILISFLILFSSYRSFYISSKSAIRSTAHKINQQLGESLNYVENISNFIGNQILEKRDANKENVAKILLNSQPKIDQKSQDIFTWTLFDYINLQDQVIASSLQGALKEPILVTKERRSWIVDSKKQPWKLLSSKVDFGIVSNEKIIPFGFGITKKNGAAAGIISLGVNVEKLQRKLESIAANSYETFAVIDRSGSIVFTSSNFDKKNIDSLVADFQKLNPHQGFFKLNDDNFYYQLNESYQFKILVGVNHKLFWSLLWEDFIPKALNTLYLTIFFLILLYFFRAKLLQPVVNLAKTANDISQGKLDALVPITDIAEVNLLAASINKVKEFLIKEEALKQSLKKGKETAESENHNKTEFLASTAHELKNMLAGVVGLGELLKLNLTERNPSRDIAELQEREDENISWIIDIVRLGEESLIFVNDILDVNQAQTGEFKIEEAEVVDLQDITLRSIKLMKTRAMHERKNIATNINKNLSKKFITSNLDPRRVKQVIVNIISNSIKYSPESSEIKINLDYLTFDETAKINEAIELGIKGSDDINDTRKVYLLSALQAKREKQESRVCIEIEDRGFGMDEEEIKIASKKYGTIKHDLTKKIDSTGLGLPIVKYLVEAQGGLFEIHSEKGKGTKVRIIF